jgi:hypothetical protein
MQVSTVSLQLGGAEPFGVRTCSGCMTWELIDEPLRLSHLLTDSLIGGIMVFGAVNWHVDPYYPGTREARHV